MQPKKSLGQNFLRDSAVLNKIISTADLNLDDNVIEIGPGEGALTTELLKCAKKIICIEKDDGLAKKLQQHYKDNKKIEIINGDILEINLPKLISENNFENYKLIANIPYYITSPIIRLFLETYIRPSAMILMVQREVAERICSSVGQMSVLSVSVQYYATAKILFDVDRSAFWPIPEVDSAAIEIIPAKKDKAPAESKSFFRMVKAGFSAKRKTLSNNLSTSLHLDKNAVEKMLAEIGLKSTVRAQELSVSDWKKLTNLFK